MNKLELYINLKDAQYLPSASALKDKWQVLADCLNIQVDFTAGWRYRNWWKSGDKAIPGCFFFVLCSAK